MRIYMQNGGLAVVRPDDKVVVQTTTLNSWPVYKGGKVSFDGLFRQ